MRRTFALFGAGVALGAVAMYFARERRRRLRARRLRRSTAPQTRRQRRAAPSARRAPIDFLTLAIKPVSIAERAALFRLAAEADRAHARNLGSASRSSAGPRGAAPRARGAAHALRRDRRAGGARPSRARLDLPAARAGAVVRDLGAPRRARRAASARRARRTDRPDARRRGARGARQRRSRDRARPRRRAADRRATASASKRPSRRRRTTPTARSTTCWSCRRSKAGAAFERIAVIWIERRRARRDRRCRAIADDSLRNEFKRGRHARVGAHRSRCARRLRSRSRPRAAQRGAALRAHCKRSRSSTRSARCERPRASPGELGTMIRRAALMSLARDDPLAALSAAEALTRKRARPDAERHRDELRPHGSRCRARLGAELEPAVAEHRCERARGSRARRSRPRDRSALRDHGRHATSEAPAHSWRSSTNGALSAEHTAEARRSLARDAEPRPALQMLTQMWAQRAAARRASAGCSPTASAAPRTALGQAAMQLARKDPAAAIAYLDSVPPRAARHVDQRRRRRLRAERRARRSGLDRATSRRTRLRRRASPRSPAEPRGERSLGSGAAVRLDQRRRSARRAASCRTGSPTRGRGKTRRAAAGWASPRSPTTTPARRPSATSRGNGSRATQPARAVGRSGCRRARRATRR